MALIKLSKADALKKMQELVGQDATNLRESSGNNWLSKDSLDLAVLQGKKVVIDLRGAWEAPDPSDTNPDPKKRRKVTITGCLAQIEGMGHKLLSILTPLPKDWETRELEITGLTTAIPKTGVNANKQVQVLKLV